MAIKFSHPFFSKMILNDIEILTSQYKALADHFSSLQNKIDNAATKYGNLGQKEKLHKAKEEVLGKDYIDLGNQFESTKELFCFGLGAVLLDEMRLGGLKNVLSIERFITETPEIKDSAASQKALELLYLNEALQYGMKSDAAIKLKQQRPDLFSSHKHDNIWGCLNLKDQDFIDYCDSIKEFAAQVDKAKQYSC